jgi:hypothetical protein
MVRCSIAVACAVLLTGCADSHIPFDGPDSADGAASDLGFAEASVSDAAGDAAWVCGSSNSPPWTDVPNPGICDDGARRVCDRWAQSQTRSHVAHTVCETDAMNPCQRGTICLPPTHIPAPPCVCGPNAAGMDAACEANEVCVSDTPDGPRYCLRACSD